MRYGVWTPLPHTIRPEPVMEAAIADASAAGRFDGEDKAFRFAVDVIQRAEALGYETTLIAERWNGTDHPAWLLATALAALTRKIELMVAVHPGLVPPAIVAKFAASLDRISGGRAAINIVNGWWREEFDTYGAGWIDDEAARYRRMGEYLDVVTGMLGEAPFSCKGEFYSISEAASWIKPVQRPHPPLYAGGRHEGSMNIIARCCDAWFVDTLTDFRTWDQNVARVSALIADMSARAARHGRTLAYGLSCHVICADTMAQAERQARDLEEHGKTSRIAFVAAKALGPGLVGPPEEIARRIALYEAAGVGTLMIHGHPMIDCIERVARDVIPLVPKMRACHDDRPTRSAAE